MVIAKKRKEKKEKVTTNYRVIIKAVSLALYSSRNSFTWIFEKRISFLNFMEPCFFTVIPFSVLSCALCPLVCVCAFSEGLRQPSNKQMNTFIIHFPVDIINGSARVQLLANIVTGTFR